MKDDWQGLIYAAANFKRYAALFPLPSPGDVQQLYDENQSGERSAPRAVRRPTTEILHNLPSQPTTFIGREEELAAAREILLRKGIQLVTFTGPGGTGKTRLSLEVANGLIEHFKDGVFFVQLADITEPDQVVAHVSRRSWKCASAGTSAFIPELERLS